MATPEDAAMELLMLVVTVGAAILVRGPLTRLIRRVARPDAGAVSRAWLARYSAPR